MVALDRRSIIYLADVFQIAWREGDAIPTLPDGVYIGLPEGLYFAQDALGTTDIGDLWKYREGWWWKSRHNPWLKKADTKAKLFGSACHTLLLEGEAAFKDRWAVQPNPRDFPDLLVTGDDLISALQSVDAPGASSKMRKADLVQLATVYLPGRHIWDAITDRFERGAREREIITAQEHWELQVMLAAAKADPSMSAVVEANGGVRLTEVSVFYTTADGIRMRFRFDSLLPQINADLKTLGNARGDLVQAVGKRIGEGALDVQAALSFEARRRAYAFIEAGQVHGGDASQRAWLELFPSRAPLDLGGKPGWAWLWMFFQKADQDGRAPIIFPVWMRFGSLEHRDGWRKALHGLAFYRQQVATVGLETPWTRVEPVHHLDAASSERRVEIPHWNERPMAADGEEEGLTWQS